MQLSEIFPEESLRRKLGDDLTVIRRSRRELAEISALKPNCMVEIGGGAWDRYVQAHPRCDAQALASYFDQGNPKLYLAMERHIGRKVLHDIHYTVVEVEGEQLEEKKAAELLLAVTYPGVLRISDVTYANPYKPILEREQRFRFQHYEGLGLFPETLERCEAYCLANGLHEITLAAAYIDLVPFFQRFGFAVEDTPAGRIYLEMEEGIPMSKTVHAIAV